MKYKFFILFALPFFAVGVVLSGIDAYSDGERLIAQFMFGLGGFAILFALANSISIGIAMARNDERHTSPISKDRAPVGKEN